MLKCRRARYILEFVLRASLGFLFLAATTALLACGEEPDTLDAFFVDEIVEAPARTADIIIFENVECDIVLSSVVEDVESAALVVSSATYDYPINPALEPLGLAPRGRGLTIHIAIRNDDGLLIARGCQEFILESSIPARVTVQLDSIPKCELFANRLDLTIVLDTSTRMELQFLGSSHLDILKEDLIDTLPGGTLLSIVTHGHTETPVTWAGPTTDRTEIGDKLLELRPLQDGAVSFFDAIQFAAQQQRARAVCQLRPAMLIHEAGAAEGATGLDVFGAQLSLYGAVGDPADDIYAFGVHSSEDARVDIAELFSELSETLQDMAGAETEGALRGALGRARQSLGTLVSP